MTSVICICLALGGCLYGNCSSPTLCQRCQSQGPWIPDLNSGHLILTPKIIVVHRYENSDLSKNRLLFHSLNDLGHLVKNQLTVHIMVYFCTLNYSPLIYMSILVPVPHYFYYCSFVVNFKIRKSESFNFVLFFQDRFGYTGSLEFPH